MRSCRVIDEHGAEPWRDPARPVAERVDLLLGAMTLDEKVAQLGSRWVGNDMSDEEPAPADEGETLNVAPMADVFAASGTIALEEASRNGLGHLTRVYGSVPLTPAQGAAELIRQQRIVIGNSRLGIPALVHEECLTGFTTFGATVYPAAIAWGATFDPDLVERMAAAIGRDMAALGVHQGLSPVLDVVRDYRWGRVEETIGEDPYLVSMVGTAYVRGLQSSGVLACLKHFAGYSASRGARNHGPVPMGRRELLDVIFPSFETALREGGAASVMNSYSDVDGVPAGSDRWLLTEVLREQWGFTGTVVSDYWAVPFLATMHETAADMEDAGAQALTAGIDVELPDTVGFGPGLLTRVPQEAVETAARRLLTQKVSLGLLDEGWTPEASVAGADSVELDSAGNRALARELAERSIVLLEPGDVLPIAPATGRIAVVGPCAGDPQTFMGCYAFPNHVLPRYPEAGLGIAVPTAAEALRAEFGGAEIVHEPGCAVLGNDRTGFAAAVAAARDADLCVAMVGDLAGLFGRGSSGEGCDAEDLRLPGVQADLLDELLATGTPVVVVVVSGRPYALGGVHERAAALVQAFMPGEEGGAAIAGVLSGRVQPSGRLPVQIPRHTGGQPGTYLQPRLGAEKSEISNLDPTPLFPFGHGRSYTSFEVGELRISAAEVPTDGEFTVSVRVRNTGERAGDEVVQLYLRDVVAQVTRPVRQLVGFARVPLEAGEAKEVTFHVHTDRTSFTGRDMVRIVEPGSIDVQVGRSAGDLPLQGSVTLTGPVRVVGAGRRLTTPVEVKPAGGLL
ncbi:glycoside hydrolase family 3 N-terminal domain-containing protein [Actinoplanes sp. NPDC051343]|uniref:glycoside hydrolase family 3 N-terminal domain-containing protein n=1 Tax=Actinoplanes sp. NPDC051343 TaxID=3363906 RepID=UPI00379E30C5